MCVVSQYFAFRQENTLRECLCLKIIGNLQTHQHFLDNFCTVHGKRGEHQFSVILYNFFHSSVKGGEDARTRGEMEMREAGKQGSGEEGSKWQRKESCSLRWS